MGFPAASAAAAAALVLQEGAADVRRVWSCTDAAPAPARPSSHAIPGRCGRLRRAARQENGADAKAGKGIGGT